MSSYKYGDWNELKNKSINCKKGDLEFDGVLIGLSDAVVAISVDKAVHPWRFVNNDGTAYDIYPEDGWLI